MHIESCTMRRADLKAPALESLAIKALPFFFSSKALNSTCSDLTENLDSKEPERRNGIFATLARAAGSIGCITVLSSPRHRPQHWGQLTEQEPLQQDVSSFHLSFCSLPAVVFKSHMGTPRAAPSQLPRASYCIKHFIFHARCCGSDPRRHPGLPHVLPWDKEEPAGGSREERKEINKSIRPQQERH